MLCLEVNMYNCHKLHTTYKQHAQQHEVTFIKVKTKQDDKSDQ
jgi:hypothetical protein